MNFYQKLTKKNAQPLVMGILNLTPDSFYDGGKFNNIENSIKQVQKMINEGADIIDIGACSSRPGAQTISVKEEEDRLLTILKEIKINFPNTIVSVDTYRYQVANKAILHGAEIINDIYFNKDSDEMIRVISRNKTPYILMHMQGQPATMQKNINYKNFQKEIMTFFDRNITKLNKKGITNIILDPGFGFGKKLEHNYILLNLIPEIKKFGYPILTGVSRKSMISLLLNINVNDTLNGTTSINTLCLEKGANIIRVHDVKEAKEVVKIFQTITSKNIT